MKLGASNMEKIHFIHRPVHRYTGDNLVHKVDNFLYYPHRAPQSGLLLFTDCNIACGKRFGG